MINKIKIYLITFLTLLGVFFAIENKKEKFILQIGLASTKKQNVIVYKEFNKNSEKLWKLNHAHWPIEIIEVNNNWAKIKDYYNTTGWIQKKDISYAYALVLNDCYAFKSLKNFYKNQANAKLIKNATVQFLSKNNNYCKIKIKKNIYYTECVNLWIGNN